MSDLQKIIKYCAMAFAVFLSVSIIGGILGVAGALGGVFDGEAVAGDVKTYAVSSDVRALDVKINAADFFIRQGAQFSVESNLKHLTVSETDNILTIQETEKHAGNYAHAVLTLYVPGDMVFDTATLTTSAGKVTVERLLADNLNLSLGAGDVQFENLCATTSAEISGGAGRIVISDGSLHDLNLDMAVGQLLLTSALTGESSLELGIGESEITVLGSREDYRLEVEKGIGSITVDGTAVSTFQEQSGGANRLRVHGGIGTIRLQFKK